MRSRVRESEDEEEDKKKKIKTETERQGESEGARENGERKRERERESTRTSKAIDGVSGCICGTPRARTGRSTRGRCKPHWHLHGLLGKEPEKSTRTCIRAKSGWSSGVCCSLASR